MNEIAQLDDADLDRDVPGPIERAHRWVYTHWPTSARRRFAIVFAIIGLGLAVVPLVLRIAGVAIDLGLLAYLGLMVVCWIGAGGALVPIPGIRPLSWVMIVQQGAVLAPPIVALVAALAMALGQGSYYLATRIEARRIAAGKGRHHRHQGRSPGAAMTTGPSVAESDPAPEGRGAQSPDGPSESIGHDGASAVGSGSSRGLARWHLLLSRGQAWITQRMATHPRRIIFLVSVVPSPLTTFATVGAANAGLPYPHVMAASLAGFLVLTTILVVAGQAVLAMLGLA